MKPQTLGMHCEPLADFREKLDQAIRTLMINLTERDLENGTVTAKIKITRKTAVDVRASFRRRSAWSPRWASRSEPVGR